MQLKSYNLRRFSIRCLFILLIGSSLFSCSSSDNNSDISIENFVPANGFIYNIGSSIAISGDLKSSDGLSSYTIEIYGNEPFSFSKTVPLGGQKSVKLSDAIAIPFTIGETESLVNEGNYKLKMTVKDRSNNAAVIIRDIIFVYDNSSTIAIDNLIPVNDTKIYIGNSITISGNITSKNNLASYTIEIYKANTKKDKIYTRNVEVKVPFETSKTTTLREQKTATFYDVIDVTFTIGKDNNPVEDGNYKLKITIKDKFNNTEQFIRDLIFVYE